MGREVYLRYALDHGKMFIIFSLHKEPGIAATDPLCKFFFNILAG